MKKKKQIMLYKIQIALQSAILIALYKLQLYVDTAKNFEARFNSSEYELDRRLPKGRNRKVTGSRKDDLGGKIMKNLLH